MLYPDAKGNETVIIPRLPRPGEELLFGILHIFRYTIRRMSGGEFPRGFLAPGLTPRANACKKLKEELGVPAGQLTELALLGQTRADTGLKSGQAQGYLADLTGPTPPALRRRGGHRPRGVDQPDRVAPPHPRRRNPGWIYPDRHTAVSSAQEQPELNETQGQHRRCWPCVLEMFWLCPCLSGVPGSDASSWLEWVRSLTGTG